MTEFVTFMIDPFHTYDFKTMGGIESLLSQDLSGYGISLQPQGLKGSL